MQVNDSTTLNLIRKYLKAAERALNSITSWIEIKLFPKVNATKSKVGRPTQIK